MSFHVTFQFTLAAGATLNQDFNIDYPTFLTSRGFKVEISSAAGGPVLLEMGTVNGSDLSGWVPFAHHRFNDTSDTRTWSKPGFTWNYLTKEVRLNVANLNSVSDTFYCTCTSDHT